MQPEAPINATPAKSTETITVRPITADFIVTTLTDVERRGFAVPYFREGPALELQKVTVEDKIVAQAIKLQVFQNNVFK